MSGRFLSASAWQSRISAGLAAALAGIAAASAQSSLGDGGYGRGGAAADAYLQRQVRALDADQRAGNVSAYRLQRIQRDLVSRSRGVALTSEQARIQRDLDRIGSNLTPQTLTGAPPVMPVPRGERLPGTIDDSGGLPSFRGAVTVGRLLDRAQDAIAGGRVGQARSDLATAQALAGDLDPTTEAEQAEISRLQARMADVRRRLDPT